ncbi:MULTISPECIES: GlcG/HbpS family heme-binding protein [Pantoea]|uniref:Heme-binding protein n=1 Tax=Candidatus Pantoea multigeneris TaxID=2608357 RepID=A0ABX0RG43_9GAMM|nr:MULTISPECIES: heme-binding protein [Pantoea]NIF23749.1 heme-binding protein [Pantoea multigeneris]
MKLLPTALLCSGLICACAQAAEPATQISTLNHQQAQRLLDKAEQIIRSHHLGGAIAVVDPAGQLITYDRLDGATLANAELAPKKAHAAVAFGASTESFQQKIAAGNVAMLGNPVVVPLPGGEPVKLNGVVVGAIGVSTPDGAVDAEAAKGALSALNAG